MKRHIRTLALSLALGAAIAPLAAFAEPAAAAADGSLSTLPRGDIPDQLDAGQREAYRAVFAAIRDSRWTDAQIGLDTMKPGPLHAIARAELFTAKGSPKVELEPLLAWLNEGAELPQAAAIARLATARGATVLPPLPPVQTLIWQDGAPRRVHAKSIKSDLIAADLALKMQPLVKADLGADAQALLEGTEGLTPRWRPRPPPATVTGRCRAAG
jgi:soluble lytic murein transglycosylase